MEEVRFDGGEPSPTPQTELDRRLREAGADELLQLIRERGESLTPDAVRHALRNPFLSREVIEELASHPRLLSFYEVRKEIAASPRTPETLALRFVPGLYWRDLMNLGLDMRVHPRVRRAADVYVAERLPRLAVGEKVSIARRASGTVLASLRHDPSPTVVAALLDNPRLTEGLLLPLAQSDGARPQILQQIAADRRWGARYGLRVALAKNPQTPAPTAVRLLSSLRKSDLQAIAALPTVAEPVRRRARLLLGELTQQ
jgi:hypothetical protein